MCTYLSVFVLLTSFFVVLQLERDLEDKDQMKVNPIRRRRLKVSIMLCTYACTLHVCYLPSISSCPLILCVDVMSSQLYSSSKIKKE